MARSVPYFGIKQPTSRRSDQPGDQGSIFLCFKKQKFPCSQGTGHVEKKRLHGTFTLYLQVQYKKITNTLYLRVDGSTRCKGHPFILMRPFPRLQKATAVAVFYRNNCPRIIHTTQKSIVLTKISEIQQYPMRAFIIMQLLLSFCSQDSSPPMIMLCAVIKLQKKKNSTQSHAVFFIQVHFLTHTLLIVNMIMRNSWRTIFKVHTGTTNQLIIRSLLNFGQ